MSTFQKLTLRVAFAFLKPESVSIFACWCCGTFLFRWLVFSVIFPIRRTAGFTESKRSHLPKLGNYVALIINGFTVLSWLYLSFQGPVSLFSTSHISVKPRQLCCHVWQLVSLIFIVGSSVRFLNYQN